MNLNFMLMFFFSKKIVSVQVKRSELDNFDSFRMLIAGDFIQLSDIGFFIIIQRRGSGFDIGAHRGVSEGDVPPLKSLIFFLTGIVQFAEYFRVQK